MKSRLCRFTTNRCAQANLRAALMIMCTSGQTERGSDPRESSAAGQYTYQRFAASWRKIVCRTRPTSDETVIGLQLCSWLSGHPGGPDWRGRRFRL